jgi:AcrR family transcriptional regulator
MDAVTVEEIADRADVARGTVFNYFATKDSICQGLGELQVEMLREAVEDGRIWGPTAGDKIKQAMLLMAEFPNQDAERCRTMLTRSLAALRPGEMPEHRMRVFEFFETWVREGQQTGELREDVPSCELAGFIMGLQLQGTLIWAYGFVQCSLGEHITRMLEFALDGIRRRN